MKLAWKTLLTTAGAAAILALSGPSAHPALIWNATPSVPVGLYRVQSEPRPKLTDIVVVRPPDDLAWFLADGRYLPRGVPLLKHVAALGGQRVCRAGLAITIDGARVADALPRDRRGHPLPVWAGCVMLSAEQIFLLNADCPDSLDGRYFGPLDRNTVIGRAVPVWTRKGA